MDDASLASAESSSRRVSQQLVVDEASQDAPATPSKQTRGAAPKKAKKKRKKSSKGLSLFVFFAVGVVGAGSLQLLYFHPVLTNTPHQPIFDHTTASAAAQLQSRQSALRQQQANNSSKSATQTLQQQQPQRNTKAVNPIISILVKAGVKMEIEDYKLLPSWETMTGLYGPLREPIIYGLEKCEQYRQAVPLEKRYAAVAGMFNTGTNAMEHHLQHNLNAKNAWQVPWGKHRMEFVRMNHTAPGLSHWIKEDCMPVVLIRDPYSWLQSMCKSPYAAVWSHKKFHCPNLVPTDQDRRTFRKDLPANASSVPVKVVFDKNQIFHWTSLAHLWSHWYKLYVDATYPRIMVRFEDMLFFGPTMLQKIAECMGVTTPERFKYQTGSAKGHGSHATFVSAVAKTGDVKRRMQGLTKEDLEYAAKSLDAQLMERFMYRHPNPADLIANNATTS